MATTQDYINQLKVDKQNLVSMLNNMGVEATESETFTSLTPKVGKIVTDPILQDKNVEITENGTTTITADSGYDGLNNVNVTTNIGGSTEIPSIKDCQYLFNSGYRISEVETVIACCTGATSMTYMFRGAGTSLNNVTGFANFKNNNSVSTEGMFMSCSGILSIDFTPNTKIVSNKTSSMFSGCSKVSKLDLSGFDFSAVTNTYGMFNGCKLLEELDISSWDFSNVTNFGTMFTNCGANLTDGELTKVYVKDATAQAWVLNSGTGRPDTWSTTNVIIKG